MPLQIEVNIDLVFSLKLAYYVTAELREPLWMELKSQVCDGYVGSLINVCVFSKKEEFIKQ